MPAIKSMAEIKEKWLRRTQASTSDYRKGVETPKKDWASQTLAAESAYERGVQEAIGRKAFGKGVSEAGTSEWQEGATKKGVDRFAPGVAVAAPRYERGFSPYADVISRTTLPPRGPKGDPANIERVAVLARALHDAKVS